LGKSSQLKQSSKFNLSNTKQQRKQLTHTSRELLSAKAKS
jgi:hypothetical protein